MNTRGKAGILSVSFDFDIGARIIISQSPQVKVINSSRRGVSPFLFLFREIASTTADVFFYKQYT